MDDLAEGSGPAVLRNQAADRTISHEWAVRGHVPPAAPILVRRVRSAARQPGLKGIINDVQSGSVQCSSRKLGGCLPPCRTHRGDHYQPCGRRVGIRWRSSAPDVQGRVGWVLRSWGYSTDDRRDGVRCVQEMRHLFLLLIRAYWAFWPHGLRRQCLYRESCSRHVYRVANEVGASAGFRALLYRVRKCRPGYTMSASETGMGLLLRDGSFLPGHMVAPGVITRVPSPRRGADWRTHGRNA